MKNFRNILMLAILAIFGATSVEAQYYGVQIDPVCWNGDSTIFVATIASPTSAKPNAFQYFQYTPGAGGVSLITVGSGTIEAGRCSSSDSTTISLQQSLLDNDTIIARLTSILTALNTANTTLGDISTNTQKDLELSPVCWDSSGIQIPLLSFLQIDWQANTVAYIYRDATGQVVTPGTGTVTTGVCRDTSSVHVLTGCYSVGTATVDLTLADNGGVSYLIVKKTDGTQDTIGTNDPTFGAGWDANLIRLVANGEGANLCTAGNWSASDEILTITGFISDYDSLVVDTPRQSFPFTRTITEQFSVQIHKVLDKSGNIISEQAFNPAGVLYDMCGVKLGNCETSANALLPYQATCIDNPDSLHVYTLLSPLGPRHPDSYSYGANFTYIAEIPLGSGSTHPVGGGDVEEWFIYAMCSDTLPADDSGGNAWLIGSADDYPTVGFVRINDDPVCGTVHLALRTVSCDAVSLDSINTELIANSLTNPTFPTGVDIVVLMNHSSDTYIQITTNLGAQLCGPNASISIENDNLTFVSISAAAGTFGSGDYLVFNYAMKSP